MADRAARRYKEIIKENGPNLTPNMKKLVTAEVFNTSEKY
jgi:hypothetical protein